MAKAVTLKNNNNEEVYPVTDISLVNGELPTARIADSAITTNKIVDSAVTSDKIDWETFKPYWKVVATSSTATVTIPRGYKIYRFTCQGTLPASPGTRAVINCAERVPNSNCYVAWHGYCSTSGDTAGAFQQAWNDTARAIAYLELVATGVANTWRATGTIQFENKTGSSFVAVNIDSMAAGSDDVNHSKGETDISAGDTFTLVIHRGSGDATGGYWVVEALDEN